MGSVDLTMWGAGCVCGLAALLTRVLLVNGSVLKESKSDMKDNDDVLDLMEENISPVEGEYAGGHPVAEGDAGNSGAELGKDREKDGGSREEDPEFRRGESRIGV